jgi:uncharacterized repeat protein (TIGR03809 family)
MSARIPLVEIAQRWRALAGRRRAHYVELYHSGRWKRYYSEQEFLRRLREAIRLSERWDEIAPSRTEGRPGQSILDHRPAA